MVRINKKFLSFVGMPLIMVASRPLPSKTEDKPSVRTVNLERTYLRSVDSIRKVDFKNFSYDIKEADADFAFQLRNGKSSSQWSGGAGGDEIGLVDVKYFRSTQTGPEMALVQLNWLSCGGSCSQSSLLLVFRVDRFGLVETQQLDFDLQAEGTGTEFDPATRALIVRARTADDSPHCCAKSIDVVTFAWMGKAFEEKTHRTIPIKK